MKINEVLANKIQLQIDEAKDHDFTKLAKTVEVALTDSSAQPKSLESLKQAMYEGIWKCALDVLGYHDLESIDIQKMDETITVLADKTLSELERAIDKENAIGPNEEPLIGQKV